MQREVEQQTSCPNATNGMHDAEAAPQGTQPQPSAQQPPALNVRRDSSAHTAAPDKRSSNARAHTPPRPALEPDAYTRLSGSSAAHCTCTEGASSSTPAGCNTTSHSSLATVQSRSPAAATVLVPPHCTPTTSSVPSTAPEAAGAALDSGSSSSTVTLQSSPASVRRPTHTHTTTTENALRPTGAPGGAAPGRCQSAVSAAKTGNNPTRVASPQPHVRST